MGATHKKIKLHKINGILISILIVLHPLFYMVYRYLYGLKLDPFYVFVDACLLCDGRYEYLLSLGRIGLYLIVLAVVAVKFNFISEYIKNNWRLFHILNYLAFYILSIHAYLIGRDANKLWFIILFAFCQIVVLISIIMRVKEISKPSSK